MTAKELIKILKKCQPNSPIELHIEFPRFGSVCITDYEVFPIDNNIIIADTRRD